MKVTVQQHPGISRVAIVLTLLVILPDTAWAYLGPGAGLGMVGSLVAVVVGILVAIAGVLLYPLRLYRKWRKEKAAKRDAA